MNYRPYTKEDKLEVGTKIRLGGREGEIYIMLKHGLFGIKWSDFETDTLSLLRFTFEIEDIPPPPLKIDKRVKSKINLITSNWHHLVGGEPVRGLCNEIDALLNSLEEC